MMPQSTSHRVPIKSMSSAHKDEPFISEAHYRTTQNIKIQNDENDIFNVLTVSKANGRMTSTAQICSQ